MIHVLSELWADRPDVLLTGFFLLAVSFCFLQSSIRLFSIRRPTIPAIFFLTYLVMIYFPSFFVYHDRPGPFRDNFLFAVISVLLTVPLGIWLANWLARYDYEETRTYFESAPQFLKSSGGMFVVHLALLGVALFCLAYYFYSVPVVPIFEMIRHPGDSAALTMAREESFKLLDPRWGKHYGTGMFYVYLFLRTVVFPVLILTSVGYALYTRKKVWFALAFITFLVGGFYAISSLSRAPISAIFMRVFFLLLLFYGGKISKKVFLSFAALMLAFPLLVTLFAYSTNNTVADALLAVGRRLTYTPALDLYYYFEIFPAAHDYLYGQTLLKPFVKLLGLPHFYIENFVALYISPFGVQSAHANAAFLSNLNADFGLVGVLGGGVVAGMLMQGVHILLTRSTKTILNMAIYSFMVYAIWVLNFGSITSVLFVNGVLPVVLMTFAMRGLSILVDTATQPSSLATAKTP